MITRGKICILECQQVHNEDFIEVCLYCIRSLGSVTGCRRANNTNKCVGHSCSNTLHLHLRLQSWLQSITAVGITEGLEEGLCNNNQL